MDTDARIATADADLTDTASAAYEEVYDKIALDSYHEIEFDMKTVMPDDNQSIDETLGLCWDRAHAREKADLIENPPMPWHDSSASMDDLIQANADWLELPKAERQAIGNADKEIAVWKEAAKKFGLEIKTPADVLAINKAMNEANGRNAANEAPPPWSKQLGIEAKNNAEANERLTKTIEQIRSEPYHGYPDAVRRLLGVEATWLAPGQLGLHVPPGYEQYYYQQQAAQQQAQPQQDTSALAVRSVIDAWAADRPDLDDGMEREMAALLKNTNFARQDSPLKRLDKAYRQVKGRRSRKGHRQKEDEALDAAVKAAADEAMD